jgi:hypothetical protein
VTALDGWLQLPPGPSLARRPREGVPPDIIDLILGHTLPKLQPTYQTHSFEREKRAALEA